MRLFYRLKSVNEDITATAITLGTDNSKKNEIEAKNEIETSNNIDDKQLSVKIEPMVIDDHELKLDNYSKCKLKFIIENIMGLLYEDFYLS